MHQKRNDQEIGAVRYILVILQKIEKRGRPIATVHPVTRHVCVGGYAGSCVAKHIGEHIHLDPVPHRVEWLPQLQLERLRETGMITIKPPPLTHLAEGTVAAIGYKHCVFGAGRRLRHVIHQMHSTGLVAKLHHCLPQFVGAIEVHASYLDAEFDGYVVQVQPRRVITVPPEAERIISTGHEEYFIQGSQ